MMTEKKISLKPILESSEGIHLTAYLVNRGDLVEIKAQLREVLVETNEWLFSVLTVDERKKFLEPLESLLNDARIFKSMKGNIGLFRTKDSFRILNVPVELERQCHVATSFHIKPLLRWMQFDREFLLLGLNDDHALLYWGNQTSIQRIDSFSYEEVLKSTKQLMQALKQPNKRQLKTLRTEINSWLNDWLDLFTQKSSPKLFIVGDKILTEGLLGQIRYKNSLKKIIDAKLDEQNFLEICNGIRQAMKNEAKKTLEQALLEFRFAEEMNLTKKNIFHIAKAAVKGKVKKLIIADEINIFGKVDKKTGGLAIHPLDLDHEDDDILDDLAQAVLASGGEVIIAPREEIPKGRPVLAILENNDPTFEKTLDNENYLKKGREYEAPDPV